MGLSISYVLDASAVLAMIHRERGQEVVAAALRSSAISTVNLAEALQSVIERGGSPEEVAVRLESLGVVIVPPTVEDAVRVAELRAPTRRSGLSLADRSCLALAERLGATALTADGAWLEAGHGVPVELIR